MNNIKRRMNFKYIIVALIAVLTLSLAGCDNKLDYSDFEDDHISSWQFAETRSESQYIVYYYGVNCSYCNDIKQEVLGFALENSADLKVYFINTTDGLEEYPIYDPLTQEPIEGTPTMLFVKDNTVRAMEVGPTLIKSLLSQIEEGSYGLID